MATRKLAPADWTVTPLAAALGAEITGIDLAVATQDDAEAIRRLLCEHLVLFFPGQRLSMTRTWHWAAVSDRSRGTRT